MRKYSRLTRSGLLIAFALSADQVAKTYGGDQGSGSDFFGLLSLMRPVQAAASDNGITDGQGDFNHFISEDYRPNSKPFSLQGPLRNLQTDVADIDIE